MEWVRRVRTAPLRTMENTWALLCSLRKGEERTMRPVSLMASWFGSPALTLSVVSLSRSELKSCRYKSATCVLLAATATGFDGRTIDWIKDEEFDSRKVYHWHSAQGCIFRPVLFSPRQTGEGG